MPVSICELSPEAKRGMFKEGIMSDICENVGRGEVMFSPNPSALETAAPQTLLHLSYLFLPSWSALIDMHEIIILSKNEERLEGRSSWRTLRFNGDGQLNFAE